MRIFLYLVASLTNRNTALLQLDVNQRHTVDKKHKIATAVAYHMRRGRKLRLSYYLVAALPCGYFVTVVNFKAYFFAKMQGVGRIVALYRHRFSVDKPI